MKPLTIAFVLLLAVTIHAGPIFLDDDGTMKIIKSIDTTWDYIPPPVGGDCDSISISSIGPDALFWVEVADIVWEDATLDIDTCDSFGLDTIRWERQCKWVPITRITSDITFTY